MHQSAEAHPGPSQISKINGTLMQIWKSHYMFAFMEKQYPENFELFTIEVCLFLKK